MSDSKELAAAHPIFLVPHTRVFWSSPVTAISPSGSQGTRQLVIASPGLFLLKKRAIGKGLTVQQAIPFSDLLLVRLDGESIDFHGPMATISGYSPKSEQIVSVVWNIRTGLFGDKPRCAKLALADPALRPRIEGGWDFGSFYLFSDRFLSASLAVSPSLYLPEEVAVIYDFLKKVRSTFVMTREILNSPLARPICLAIACHTEIQSLEIHDFSFPALLASFLPIIRYNSSIKTISFNACTFDGPLKPYFDIWSTKTEFAVSDWMFSDCDLSSRDFILFLHAFKYYPADISQLAFINCKMNSETLETICHRILTSPCFRTLKEMSICRVPSAAFPQVVLMQIFSSNFFTEQRNLSFLNLSECGFEISEMVPHFCRHETSISSLVLSGNRLSTIDGLASITDFQRISDLNLSQISCTGETLLTLFTTLSKASRAPRHLILDSLDLSNPGPFYEKIAGFELKSLTLFSFCYNEMTHLQFVTLVAFIRKQPHLFALGLSGTVCTADAVAELIALFLARGLRALELRNGDEPLGPLLIPLLDALLTRPTITQLDITGQAVGDAGIERLAALAGASLEDLRCDGSAPSSHDVLLRAISQFAISRLVSCSWPHTDLSALTETILPRQRKPVMEQFEVLRETFEKRMSPGTRADILARFAKVTDVRLKTRSHVGVNQLAAERKMLSYRDSFVQNGLLQVFDVGQWSEPLLMAVDEREATDSLEALLRGVVQ
jgi:hypothetical protein